MVAALSNIRVADFSHMLAGPHCTMSLADMGAEVIKVESPTGDATRAYTPPEIAGQSPSFLCMNRNKKGIVLDLSDERGRAIALRLASRSDILVENFATGVMKKFGLDYETLRGLNPRLIYCSISAYGREGPLSDRAGYDPVIQAESGLISMTGEAGGTPYRTGLPFIDLCTGMFAAQAILGALHARHQTGEGQFIDVPLYDTAANLTGYYTLGYLASGTPPSRVGNGSPIAAPAGLYDARDGKLYLTVGGDRVWKKLLAALGNPPELLDPEFATNPQRLRSVERLNGIMQSFFSQHDVAHWVQRLRAAGVPVGPLQSIAQASESAEFRSRALLGSAPHASGADIGDIRMPWTMSGTPSVSPRGAPILGEHTRSVLRDQLGYPVAEIAELERAGVIHCADGSGR